MLNQDLENLDDEPDTRLGQGTLTFTGQTGSQSQASAHIRSWSKVPRDTKANITPEDTANGDVEIVPTLTFEIVSARTISDEKEKKHVAYTIMVRKGPNQDPNPAVIERRYSDFLKLYLSLRRDFPQLMNSVTFPKKVLLGNFTPELISERSSLFEDLLHHISQNIQLKTCTTFTTFLHEHEYREAKCWMKLSRFEESVPLLENTFYLVNKLYTDRHPKVMLPLCEVVACHFAIDGFSEAEKFAELALQRFEAVSDADILEYYVPLLQLCVRLWWALGKDKRGLEARLLDLKQKGVKVDGCPSLLEALRDKYI